MGAWVVDEWVDELGWQVGRKMGGWVVQRKGGRKERRYQSFLVLLHYGL